MGHEKNVVMARHPMSPTHLGVEASRGANSQSALSLAESTPQGQTLVNTTISYAHFVHLGMLLPKYIFVNI